MGKQIRYKKYLYLKKEGVGVETLDGDPVDPHKQLVLEDIAVEDETSALNYIRIGKMDGSNFFLWEEHKNPNAGELVSAAKFHKLNMGECFRCTVSGGVANDIIRCYIEGYIVDWKE
jgi:hypothetical protein